MKKMHRLVTMSNISIEPFLSPLIVNLLDEVSVSDEYVHVPFMEYRLPQNRKIWQNAQIILVWMNLESLIPDIQSCGKYEEQTDLLYMSCLEIYKYISELTKTKIVWISFEDYFLYNSIVEGDRYCAFADIINIKLQHEMSENVSFIDLKRIIAEVGLNNAYVIKNKYRWNYPYSQILTERVCEEVRKQWLIESGITKKCLVLDCDNVLWGGILSEDGIENIKVGQTGLGWEYYVFQNFLLFLYSKGVILTICSKNDLSDVLRVFREHSGMVLQEKHIACFMVNWENKPDNIREIAKKLNISLNSMVFVDDTPMELESVKVLLPEVFTIRYHREDMYKHFSCFNIHNITDANQINKRTETYRTDQYRQDLKEKSKTYKEYIEALEMKVDIHKALQNEWNRISELTQRTNKCTNGVRCTVHCIKEWIEDRKVILFSVYLSDKYSDLGLVGVFGVRDDELLVFSLSCRALGREVEVQILNYIQENCAIASYYFISTGKNHELEIMLEAWRGKKGIKRKAGEPVV